MSTSLTYTPAESGSPAEQHDTGTEAKHLIRYTTPRVPARRGNHARRGSPTHVRVTLESPCLS